MPFQSAEEILKIMKAEYEATGKTEFDDIRITNCHPDVLKDLLATGLVCEKENSVSGTLIYLP